MAAKRPLRRRSRNPWVRRLKRTLWFLSFVFLIALSAMLAVYIPIYQEASDDAINIERRLTVNDSNPTIIWSADRQMLYKASAVRRKVVDLTKPEYPSYVRYAIVAAEDRRFFDHKGVDPMGLGRSVFNLVAKRRIEGGGSTISMQLAKMLINGDSRSFRRKLKDIATAQQIENLRTKDEILNLYANLAYFGQHAFGIERAAQVYFGKSADKLTVGEAAMLARCVRLPTRVNPVRTPDKMLKLRNYVLQVMLEEGWISQGQFDEGTHEVPKVLHPKSSGDVQVIKPEAGYFVRHVLAQIRSDYPGTDVTAGGYNIYTTLNLALQRRAMESVKETLREHRGDRVNDGAIVAMNGRGEILAMIGGPDEKRQFNVITQGRLGRQPGSSFKAIVYATALKNGIIHPGQMLSNAPIHKKIGRNRYWSPGNASRRENRPEYSLETAFAASVNLPAIHTIEATGVQNVVAAAHDIFGIQSKLDPVESLALGSSGVKPIEMLEAYSVFMLGGNRVSPQAIVKVVGPDGEEISPKFEPKIHSEVLDATVAKQMDEILKGPVWSPGGTATYAQCVPNAHGKTGTTNDHKDAWFCGYSDGIVGVAWTGNTARDGSQLSMGENVFGGTVAVKVWCDVMQAAHSLHLTDSAGSSPGTSVGVQASPDEPRVKAIGEDNATPDRPRPVPGDEPNPGPVDINPSPNSVPPPATDPDDAPPDTQTDGPPAKTPPAKPPIDPDDEMPVDQVEKPKRHRDSAPPKETQMEAVEVCVDTGLKASMYCPETVTRMFPKGRGPRKVCTLHHG